MNIICVQNSRSSKRSADVTVLRGWDCASRLAASWLAIVDNDFVDNELWNVVQIQRFHY